MYIPKFWVIDSRVLLPVKGTMGAAFWFEAAIFAVASAVECVDKRSEFWIQHIHIKSVVIIVSLLR